MKNRPLVIAHRGASGSAPENTLASVRKAIEIGSDMVEIDVHTTLDGRIVVMHDGDVGRTTGGKGLISQLNLDYIKELDAGSWFGPAFAREGVPTLREVLRLANGRTGLCVEIKSANPTDVLALVRTHGSLDRTILFDFNHDRLYEAKDHEPGVRTLALGVNHDNLDALSHDLLHAVGCAESATDAALVDRVHGLGIRIFVYTVNDNAGMLRLIKWGVDGIITNEPERCLRVLSHRPDGS